MERIKNFHIFDRSLPVHLTDITDRLFFVCCVLTNFHPPLCTILLNDVYNNTVDNEIT